MVTKSESIALFLKKSTHDDLASLYNINMECQVNVSQDGGERIEGEFKGTKWHGWTDGFTTWKSFRIPYGAKSDPHYDDTEMRFDLAAHAEGIGMTGWDWRNRVSKWVAFDFDSIANHDATGLTHEELESIQIAATDIEWVTIRKSTSGKGLHLYVFVDDVPTETHTEHAALARSILGKMSAITGYNFSSKVDGCGGNMWIWHRKMRGTDGLTIVKQGGTLYDIPVNWKDHIAVVSGSRRKNLPKDIQSDSFDELTGQRQHIQLDEEHKKLINYLEENDALWWWDQDHHMLVTHTYYLRIAHEKLGFRGIFKTNSPSTNINEQNCFCFPMRRGAWSVRRYTPGITEDSSWFQDGAGWTTCYLNREPDLSTACRTYGGIEDAKGGFVFREAEMAALAATSVGANITIPNNMLLRPARLIQHKDGRLMIELDRDDRDSPDNLVGWLPDKKLWKMITNTQVMMRHENETVCDYDDVVRHLVTPNNESFGWVIKTADGWYDHPLTHVRVALGSLGYSNKDITTVLGNSVFKPWKMVNKPFEPEYPGDREWNRGAAQLRFTPTKDSESLSYPTWRKILNHCGSGLDEVIAKHPWCRANGILTGADYLKCWVASLFQQPNQPLPYLFLWGPQNSGKTAFHEALSMLLTKGYIKADVAITSESNFSGELQGAIICVIEEIDLNKNRTAYNRIKDWVTSRNILIHPKNETPYHIRNTTHWIQCSNDHTSCPIYPGDTRITMCYVGPLEPIELIPKKKLEVLLEKEAPDFLAEILNLEIPDSNDRLNVPVIETSDKSAAQNLNKTHLEVFIEEKCTPGNGRAIKFSNFYERFKEWCDASEFHNWSKIRVGREIPPQYPKARYRKDGHFYIANLMWADETADVDEDGRFTIDNQQYLEVIHAKRDS